MLLLRQTAVSFALLSVIALSILTTALQSIDVVSLSCFFHHRACISRRKNRHGHWVCRMSTGRKNGLMWRIHTLNYFYFSMLCDLRYVRLSVLPQLQQSLLFSVGSMESAVRTLGTKSVFHLSSHRCYKRFGHHSSLRPAAVQAAGEALVNIIAFMSDRSQRSIFFFQY